MTNTTEKTYTVTAPSGAKFTLRPIPKHLFFLHGQLPTSFSEKAMQAAASGDVQKLGEEVLNTISDDEAMQMILFAREAVRYAMVSPKLSLSPTGADEISPFDITEEDFTFLSQLACSPNGGGLAEGLNSFRRESDKTAANRTNRKTLRKTSK